MKRSFIFVICLAIFNACGGGGEENRNLEKNRDKRYTYKK